MVELKSTAASGYLVKVYDGDENDELAQYYVVADVPDGTAAMATVLSQVPEQGAVVVRNADKSEVEGLASGEIRKFKGIVGTPRPKG